MNASFSSIYNRVAVFSSSNEYIVNQRPAAGEFDVIITNASLKKDEIKLGKNPSKKYC